MSKNHQIPELIIDPEFESYIPPLSPEEFAQLEDNILCLHRVIDPIIVWNRNVIVDGHNRYRIIKKHPEIQFMITEPPFETREEVLEWICRMQLGRRNLTPEQKKYLIGKQYASSKTSHGGSRHNSSSHDSDGRFTAKCQNETLRSADSIADRIAQENHIARSSVFRAERFAKGVDAAEEALPGIKQEILTGKIKPTQEAVAAVALAAPEKRSKLAEQLRSPKLPKTKKTSPDPPELPEIQLPKRSEILAMAKSMYHSGGQAIGTVEAMIYEMNSAMQDMIFRWDYCNEAFVKPIHSKEGKRQIRELAEEGIKYLKQWAMLT